MAGESPDRSERERSSGETTVGGGVVARPEQTAENERQHGETTTEQAPQAGGSSGPDGAEEAPKGSAEPADGASPGGTAASGTADTTSIDGSGGPDEAAAGAGTAEGAGTRTDEGDARLKSAVAAWVAGDRGPDGDGQESDGRGDTGAASVPASRSGDSGTSAEDAKEAKDAEDAASGSADGSSGGTSRTSDTEDAADKGGGSARRPAAADLPVRPRPGEGSGSAGTAGDDGGDSRSGDDAGSAGSARGGRKGAKGGKNSGGKGADAKGTGKRDAAVSGGDAPTAMFGIVRRGEAKDSDEAAAERAERLTAAFFGSSKGRDDAEEAEAEAADGSSTSGGATGSGGAAGVGEAKDAKDAKAAKKSQGAKSATDAGSSGGGQGGRSAEGSEDAEERRAADGRGEDGAGRDGGKDAGGGARGGKGRAAASGSVDHATAVFRVPEGKDGESGPAAGAEAKGGTSGKGGSGPVVDQPTAVFRSPAASGTDGSGASGTSAKGTGGRDGEKAGTAASGKAGAATRDPRLPDEESESEQTSTFVPLRSADEPRTPAASLPPESSSATVPPKPSASPAAGAGTAKSGKAAAPWSSAPPMPAGEPAEGADPERTRQQQAPGASPEPLDLLAQLTNTPPPPETPLRATVRRVKIWTPLVLLLAVIFVVVQAVRPLPDPKLSMTVAESYTFEGSKPSVPWPSEGQAVLDVEGLGSLGSYGAQKPVPIASVAKVMTAYVILRDHPVKKGSAGPRIPVDEKAEKDAGLSAQNESTVDVKAGQKMTEREAINAIMIASANNVARLLARWDAGSEKAFVKKMNDAAKDLGMTNSTYTDPSGLRPETVSTAADQVKLAKKVMDIPLFREIVRQPQYEDMNGKTQQNWNKLVPVDGVVGIKTGTTTKAGGNLVFAAEKEIGGTKQLVVGAVLGQYKPSILDTVLGESKKLIDTAQNALTSRKVVKKGDVVGYVDDRLGGKTPVVATRDVSAVGWSGLKVKLGLTDNGKAVPHEAKSGTKVGTLTVGDGPGQVKVPVALQKPLGEPGFGSKLTRVS